MNKYWVMYERIELLRSAQISHRVVDSISEFVTVEEGQDLEDWFTDRLLHSRYDDLKLIAVAKL